MDISYLIITNNAVSSFLAIMVVQIIHFGLLTMSCSGKPNVTTTHHLDHFSFSVFPLMIHLQRGVNLVHLKSGGVLGDTSRVQIMDWSIKKKRGSKYPSQILNWNQQGTTQCHKMYLPRSTFTTH